MFSQTSFNLSNCFIALVLDLVCEILSWYGFPKMWNSTSKLKNHLIQVILIIALHDCLTI
jgi:hypothetical protein